MEAMRVVLCTITPAAARDLARLLVEEKLAACVNILPGLTSVYRWEGAVCEDGESLLIIKTTAARMEQVTSTILGSHGYEVPEVISLAIEAGEGNRRYLDWLVASVGVS
ncbi:MAG: divalent-cation tolerance protein CutA [Bradymonadales bacterium]|nr:divalent-cation tolerance protein CutA [Bradymonadales bacterium]